MENFETPPQDKPETSPREVEQEETKVLPLEIVLKDYLDKTEDLGELANPVKRAEVLKGPLDFVPWENLQVGRKVSEGTFTTDVYEGVLTVDGEAERVAIKLYKGEAGTLRADYKGLELLAESYPDNAPTVFGYAQEPADLGGRFALVVSFVEGNTLEKAEEKVPREFFDELESVVEGMHKKGIICRDSLRITGENIQNNQGRPVILELELSPGEETNLEAAEDLKRLDDLRAKFQEEN